MLMIYWCCFREEVNPPVHRLLLHSGVWLFADSDSVTEETYIVCQVSGVFTLLKLLSFQMSIYPSCVGIWNRLVSELILCTPGCISPPWRWVVILVPTVLYSNQQLLHCKCDSDDSLGSLGNQVLRDQERSISHFSEWRQSWLDKGKVGGRED